MAPAHRATLAAAAFVLLCAALPAQANYQITCESNGNRYKYCNANTSGRVRLVEQYSHNGCRQGRDWGYDWNGVWVSNGCRARFEVGGRDTGGGGGGGGGKNDAGNALAVAGGLAILGAIIANADNGNDSAPPPPRPPAYNAGVPPWAVGSFYGQDPYSGAWQTISIDPNGGAARYLNGFPPAYGNYNNGALYFGAQGLAVQPSGGGITIGGAYYRRQ